MTRLSSVREERLAVTLLLIVVAVTFWSLALADAATPNSVRAMCEIALAVAVSGGLFWWAVVR